MQPYRLIKDNDSGYESSDIDGILDGNITDMLDYNLKIKGVNMGIFDYFRKKKIDNIVDAVKKKYW